MSITNYYIMKKCHEELETPSRNFIQLLTIIFGPVRDHRGPYNSRTIKLSFSGRAIVRVSIHESWDNLVKENYLDLLLNKNQFEYVCNHVKS